MTGVIRRWVKGSILISGGAVAATAISLLTATGSRADADDSLYSGLGLADATGAATELPVITSAAPAELTPPELLSEATTNLTDANQVLHGLDVSGLTGQSGFLDVLIGNATVGQNISLQDIATLGASEGEISSYGGGELSSFVTPLFTEVDQQWYQASEAALVADQALQAAVASDSGLDAAQLAVLSADTSLLFDSFNASIVDFGASLLTSF